MSITKLNCSCSLCRLKVYTACENGGPLCILYFYLFYFIFWLRETKQNKKQKKPESAIKEGDLHHTTRCEKGMKGADEAN